jgi:hypothetical protein
MSKSTAGAGEQEEKEKKNVFDKNDAIVKVDKTGINDGRGTQQGSAHARWCRGVRGSPRDAHPGDI